MEVLDGGDSRVLALCRRSGERELVCLFNFSNDFVRARVERGGAYTELMYGTHYDGLAAVDMWPGSFAWLLRDAGDSGRKETQQGVQKDETL